MPASSGKTTRHRLSRGGDRNANHALYQVVLVRMASCQRTKDYVAKRTAEGKSKREIMRCLKRYAAREIYRQITNPQAAPDNTPICAKCVPRWVAPSRPQPANLANGPPKFPFWNGVCSETTTSRGPIANG
ncbi:transposase [Pseudarthrobacter sp. O4]|uniref:transposase n=1 Tax=Pseudarthrobacter sp. O4 TaxID=3418417 RepID=UPI003CEFDABA